jgi:hypothetical protein
LMRLSEKGKTHHEVADRVDSSTGASVSSGGASVSGLSLWGGVGNEVSSVAAVLEGVVETEPMSNLSCRRQRKGMRQI